MLTLKIIQCVLICGMATANLIPHLWLSPYAMPAKHQQLPEKATRQKFILDVLLQVHKPLLSYRLMSLGESLITDAAMYRNPMDNLLLSFLEVCQKHMQLKPAETYNELNMQHVQQFVGLSKFLIEPRDWSTFQQNVCYARMRMNAVLFVFALNVAVNERPDTRDLRMPALNEILPQLFYERALILDAEDVAWQDLSKNTQSVTTRQSHLWQVLHLHFNLHLNKATELQAQLNAKKIVLQANDNTPQLVADAELQIFWANIVQQWLWQIVNDNRRLFVENEFDTSGNVKTDNDRTNYWYSIVAGDGLMRRARSNEHLKVDFVKKNFNDPQAPATEERKNRNILERRQDELLFFNLQQMHARLYVEQYANNIANTTAAGGFNASKNNEKLQEIPATNFLTAGGIAYQTDTRINSNATTYLITTIINELKVIIDRQLQQQPLTRATIVHAIAAIFNTQYTANGSAWQLKLSHLNDVLYAANSNTPTLLNIATSYLRDANYLLLLNELMDLIAHYRRQLLPHTLQALSLPELQGIAINVDTLVTYEEPVDTNLLNLIDLQLLQATDKNNIFLLQNQLVATQMRLNYRPFNITYQISSAHNQHVVLRTFLLPKYSAVQATRLLTWREQQLLAIQLDIFSQQLTAGANKIERHSSDISWSTASRTSGCMRDMYQQLWQSLGGAGTADMSNARSKCGLPQHLLIPRGLVGGMQMQIFVIATPFQGAVTELSHLLEAKRWCGFGLTGVTFDDLPLEFPFDREILKKDLPSLTNVILTNLSVEHTEPPAGMDLSAAYI